MPFFIGADEAGGRDRRPAGGPVMVEAARSMPGRWTAATCTCLMVALYAAEPAVVSLTVHDHVQLDRVTGTSAQRRRPCPPPWAATCPTMCPP
jgi:hypothetical protein